MFGGGTLSNSFEYAMSGFDTELGGRVMRFKSVDLRAFVGTYYFGVDNGPETWGGRARVEGFRPPESNRRPSEAACSPCYKSQIPDRPAAPCARGEGEPMMLQACPKCGAQFDVSESLIDFEAIFDAHA